MNVNYLTPLHIIIYWLIGKLIKVLINYFIGLAQRSPTISYITQTQIKDIGGTVELSCSVQYTSEYPVIWMKIDPRSTASSLPISTGSSLILHESRYSLRYDTVCTHFFQWNNNRWFITLLEVNGTNWSNINWKYREWKLVLNRNRLKINIFLLTI